MDSATSSGRTNCVAPSKPDGPGSSALTFQPPPNQRNRLCARVTAVSRSGSQQIGIWPIFRDSVSPRASSQLCTRSASGSTVTRWSAIGAKRFTDWSPETATPICTRSSGRSQLGGVHAEVVPVEVHVAALEQCPDDLHRLVQHLVTDVDRRP